MSPSEAEVQHENQYILRLLLLRHASRQAHGGRTGTIQDASVIDKHNEEQEKKNNKRDLNLCNIKSRK